jgi:hypothetical protein
VLFGVNGEVLARVALIHVGYLHQFAHHFLHLLGQNVYMLAVPGMRRRDPQSQEMRQRFDGHVRLRTFFPIGSVIFRAASALQACCRARSCR